MLKAFSTYLLKWSIFIFSLVSWRICLILLFPIRILPAKQPQNVVTPEKSPIPESPLTQEKTKKMHAISRFTRVGMLAAWFGSHAANHIGGSSVDSSSLSTPSKFATSTTLPLPEPSPPPIVKTPYEYALIRLDALGEQFPFYTLVLVCILLGSFQATTCLSGNSIYWVVVYPMLIFITKTSKYWIKVSSLGSNYCVPTTDQ